MNDRKQPLDRKVRTKLRLGEVERIIKENRVIVPVPSRQSLIRMCESGKLETVGGAPTTLGWLVYEDSLWEWIREFDADIELDAGVRR